MFLSKKDIQFTLMRMIEDTTGESEEDLFSQYPVIYLSSQDYEIIINEAMDFFECTLPKNTSDGFNLNDIIEIIYLKGKK